MRLCSCLSAMPRPPGGTGFQPVLLRALPVAVVAGMTLTSLDQLWVADITYIRLERVFVYLAVILDAYSRRVVGAGRWSARSQVG